MKVILAIVLLVGVLMMSGLAFAAIPDKLLVSEQPETIDADGESCTDITAQLIAVYDDGDEEPVKMCGVEVQCESQNQDILSFNGGATAVGWTDEFGQAHMKFCSTGSEGYNIGDVEVICRSLRLEKDSSIVHVQREWATRIVATMCPKSGFDALDDDTKTALRANTGFVESAARADIVADGKSRVYVNGQLKNPDGDGDCDDVPIKKSGTMSFKSTDTSIIKTCEPPGTVYYNIQGQKMTILENGNILVETDNGVALAEFCSAGSGSENIGTATIMIESVDFPNVEMTTMTVTTTNIVGIDPHDGFNTMSAMPHQILADAESCLQVCAQIRDPDYKIVKKSGQQVLFESDETTLLIADPSLPYLDPNDVGLAFALTNAEGIALYKYCSAGRFDSLNVGNTVIRSSRLTIVQEPSVTVETKTTQIWPVAVEAKATMPIVNCDGESTVTVTAQLLDRCGYAVPLEGRCVIFRSSDISLLKDPANGGAIIDAYTDKYGKAHATFITTDCNYGGTDGEDEIKIYTQSPAIVESEYVKVVKPDGFVPDGVNVYTDQGLLGSSEEKPAHAKPYVISADGEEKTYVTAQVCEWVYDGEREYCNPVKRQGIEIQFEILDTHVVENVHDNVDAIEGTHNGDAHPSYVKMLTDDEGTATIILRSTGDASINRDKCTLIKVDAKDGKLLGTAYAEVCTKGEEGIYPNAIWVWADPAIITADGVSHTTLRAALYECYGEFDPDTFTPKSMDQLSHYSYLNDNCKPVHMPGVTIKFETMNTNLLHDGMGGYRIYTTTDEYGQAHAVFQSRGFDRQHVGPAEIEVWTIGSGEDVVQLNNLIVHTEEKTWPWCEYHPEPEICDGVDNDLDGEIDEDLIQDCYTGPPGTEDVGICHSGTETCMNGDWGTCDGEVTPQDELCNTLDDDCNGLTDDVDNDKDGLNDCHYDLCRDTHIPELYVPQKELGTNRFALIDQDTIFDTINPKGKGPQKSFTLEDTRGCSCEQILGTHTGDMNGHWKYGCSISIMDDWISSIS